MNHQEVVQFAVRCLSELDAHPGEPISYQEISQRQGIPLLDCVRVLKRLIDAGIVSLASAGYVLLSRPVEDLTALDIIDAVWSKTNRSIAVQMLYGKGRGENYQQTLEIVNRFSEVGMNG